MSRARYLVHASASVLLVAFALNVVWEFAHTVLYRWPARITPTGLIGGPVDSLPVTQFVLIHFYAAFMDACIITFFLLGGIVLFRSRAWWEAPTQSQYAVLLAAGLIVSVWIEYHAVMLTHAWTYAPMMPTIAGIGVTPVAQMLLTPALSFWLARRISFPKTTTGRS